MTGGAPEVGACDELRAFLARVMGWSNERAVDLALRSLALASDHRAALVLCGEGDMVPIAWALHRRTLGPDRAFIVCDPRRGTKAASVRVLPIVAMLGCGSPMHALAADTAIPDAPVNAAAPVKQDVEIFAKRAVGRVGSGAAGP